MEHEPTQLWIKSDSEYKAHDLWLQENFHKNERLERILIKSDNVLNPNSIIKVKFYVKVKIVSIYLIN